MALSSCYGPDTNSEGEHSFTRVDLLRAGSKQTQEGYFDKYCYLPNLLQQSNNKRSDKKKHVIIYIALPISHCL